MPANQPSTPVITEHERSRSSAPTRRAHPGRLRPRPLAAAQQLGPLGRRCSRRPATPRSPPAGRTTPRPSRRRTRTPRSSRTRPSARSPTTSTAIIRGLDREAGRHRPLVRRPAGADPRRARAGGGDGRHRPGAVPRRAAAAVLGAEVRLAGPGQPGQPQPRGPADLRAVPLRLRQRRQRGRRPRSFTRPSPCRRAGAPLFQAATANLNPWTEAKVDTENPERGPLLIVSGEKDHTVRLGDRQRRRSSSSGATPA